MTRFAASAALAAVAFALYYSTLLPDFDFGDTGSFQATVGAPVLTPRDAYPLYFTLGDWFVRATSGNPARALNLASAVEGALACGVLVLVAAELSGSLLAASAAAFFFAVSYTFWSQAIIAEVYSLHALFMALTLALLLWWAKRPSLKRLCTFFAVYALGFGNHLSMILLLPGFAVFLLISTPSGWRSMLAPRVVALALAIAALGTLQYAGRLHALYLLPDAPSSLLDALSRFWFDVTKSDWRDTMVLRVPRSIVADRFAMYGFDLWQQFGWATLLAPLGMVLLLRTDWRRALLMLLLYVVNFGFAFTYNVGDSHVFFLPSHLILALLFAPAIVLIGSISRRRFFPIAVASVAITCAGVRAYRDYPALDRSDDHRPTNTLSTLSSGLDDQRAILLTDLNWQVQNGLAYYAKYIQPHLAYARLADVLLWAPALARDNLAAGRDVALTERAQEKLTRAFGPLMPTEKDPLVNPLTIAEFAGDLPRDTRYVLCVLRPARDTTLDRRDLRAAVARLAPDTPLPEADYVALAGLAGQKPVLALGAATPFRETVELAGIRVQVRMESWLSIDTIRRMGFGQVVAARRHTLIVERGVSLAAFDGEGRAIRTVYAANIFAPQSRYLIQQPPHDQGE